MIVSMHSSIRDIYEFIDYIPFASSCKSVYVIFYRCFLAEDIDTRRKIYDYAYLEKGGWSRDVVLLVPLVGNAIVIIYDLFFAKQRLELETTSNTASASGSETPPPSIGSSENPYTALTKEKKGIWRYICFCF